MRACALLVGCCVQVWESTPGFGDKPFLDTLWTSIDEVGSCSTCSRSSTAVQQVVQCALMATAVSAAVRD